MKRIQRSGRKLHRFPRESENFKASKKRGVEIGISHESGAAASKREIRDVDD